MIRRERGRERERIWILALAGPDLYRPYLQYPPLLFARLFDPYLLLPAASSFNRVSRCQDRHGPGAYGCGCGQGGRVGIEMVVSIGVNGKSRAVERDSAHLFFRDSRGGVGYHVCSQAAQEADAAAPR